MVEIDIVSTNLSTKKMPLHGHRVEKKTLQGKRNLDRDALLASFESCLDETQA